MKITNLTNSPHDLLNAAGKKVRLPARGTIENFEPAPSQAGIYRSIGYFRIEDDARVSAPATIAPPAPPPSPEGKQYKPRKKRK